MANKTKMYAAVALLLIITAIAALVIGTATESYDMPEDYADNRTLEHSEGSFIINDVIRYPAKVNMSAFNASERNITVGVAAQTYELHFGNVPQNITVRKFIDLKNNEKGPVRLCFTARGEISPHINFTQGRTMVLESGQASNIEIQFNSERIGIMNGEIDIVVRKPKYDFGGYVIGFVGC